MADGEDEFNRFLEYNDDWMKWATDHDFLDVSFTKPGSSRNAPGRLERAIDLTDESTATTDSMERSGKDKAVFMNSSSSSNSKLKFVGDSAFFHLNYLNRRVSCLEAEVSEKIGIQQETNTQPGKPAEVKRADLDRVCIPVFREYLEPIGSQLHMIVTELEGDFPRIPRKRLLSLVRKWFRKRREELTVRIVQIFKSRHDEHMPAGENRNQLFRDLRGGTYDFQPLIRGVKMSLVENNQCIQFFRERILSFLERLE